MVCGYSKLSLNDYKKWFQSRIDENPEYDYAEDNYTVTPHICPVCGKYEFEDTDSHDIGTLVVGGKMMN